MVHEIGSEAVTALLDLELAAVVTSSLLLVDPHLRCCCVDLFPKVGSGHVVGTLYPDMWEMCVLERNLEHSSAESEDNGVAHPPSCVDHWTDLDLLRRAS